MDETYLMHSIDRRNKRQRQEHHVNHLQETDASDSEVSVSETSTQRGRQNRGQARLDSYEQAHVSREMLQNMQQSYMMNTGSHNDLFLDEKSIVNKRTLRWIISGLIIIILLLILIIVLAAIAAVVFVFIQSELHFASSPQQNATATSAQSVSAQSVHVQSVIQDIEFLFDEIQRLEENMNVSNIVIFASNEAIPILSTQINQLIHTTNDNILAIERLFNQLNQLTHSTQNNFSIAIPNLSTVQTDVRDLRNRMSNIETQLTTVQRNITNIHSVTNGMQMSINTINNQLSSPVNLYQNCRQDTSTCNLTTFRDTRLFCSTSAMPINIQVSFTVILISFLSSFLPTPLACEGVVYTAIKIIIVLLKRHAPKIYHVYKSDQ